VQQLADLLPLVPEHRTPNAEHRSG
jgi:hypothetical protein